MRKAINDNPMVQIALIGVLVVIVGFFMMTNLKKKDAAPSPGTDASATPGVAAPSTGGSAPSVAPDAGTSGSAGSVAPPPATTGTVTAEALIPGPGLPQNVVTAWKRGDAIVLLIVRGGGIDDRMTRAAVRSLNGDPGTSVFVARAKDVARYSRITQGVGVNRVPALVVVRPRKQSGSVPQAQVSYGFRDSQSVVQAVHDAIYNGRDDLPYYPR